jgi:DNA-binding Lrp family transcriptional regulator
MMTILMIDVEAGKEDLFDRLYKNLTEMTDTQVKEKIQILYLAKCYTHSDISLLVDVKDPEALPPFIVNIILQMDGVWDIQLIPLLNPNFFEVPEVIKKGSYENFTVTLDVRSDKTKTVYNQIKEMAADPNTALSFLAYSFYSYENDIILSFQAKDLPNAGKFVNEEIRAIDGVIDTYLWQIERWKFVITAKDLLDYINSTRTENPITYEEWEQSYQALMDAYICAC